MARQRLRFLAHIFEISCCTSSLRHHGDWLVQYFAEILHPLRSKRIDIIQTDNLPPQVLSACTFCNADDCLVMNMLQNSLHHRPNQSLKSTTRQYELSGTKFPRSTGFQENVHHEQHNYRCDAILLTPSNLKFPCNCVFHYTEIAKEIFF